MNDSGQRDVCQFIVIIAVIIIIICDDLVIATMRWSETVDGNSLYHQLTHASRVSMLTVVTYQLITSTSECICDDLPASDLLTRFTLYLHCAYAYTNDHVDSSREVGIYMMTDVRVSMEDCNHFSDCLV